MIKDDARALVEYNRANSQKLFNICAPLFNTFGFTSFGYTRIYEDGKRLILETNEKWLEVYSQNKFQEDDDGPKSLVNNLTNLIYTSPPQELYINILKDSPQSCLHNCLFSLGIWNTISIYVYMNKFIEVFHLGAGLDGEGIMNFCLNKKEFLKRFIYYFRAKIYSLGIEKAPYIIDVSLSNIFFKNTPSTQDEKIEKFFRETSIDKFYLKTHDKFITKREAECLHYLAYGKSSKEIAIMLGISNRTVDAYMAILKSKLQAFTKNALVDISHANYLDNKHYFEE